MANRRGSALIVRKEPDDGGSGRGFVIRIRVGTIKTVEHRGYVLQQRIVARLERARARDDGREACRFGYRNPADIQMMHQRAQASQGRIALESETCEQDLERHFRVHVREWRTIEVEADSPLGAILRPLQPDKARLRVDEVADQPGRTDAIDPEVFTRCPRPAVIILAIQSRNLAMRRPRLIGREPRVERRLRIRERAFYLLLRLSRT